MTPILPTIHAFKADPSPPLRVRWICNRARVSRHHAAAIDALLFEGAR